jgi:cell division protein DivIC
MLMLSPNDVNMALSSNPWQSIWQRLPAPLQNRYYLTLLVFFFILVFLDRHSLWTQWRLFRAQQRLESDKAFYQDKIKEARDEAEDFDLTKEKYAREHYFMKQHDEDVFIIQEKK